MKFSVLFGVTFLLRDASAFVRPASSMSVLRHMGHLGVVIHETVSESECTWSPQDLTTDNPGYTNIPDSDYIKLYQTNPEQLWPIEFFIIAYRRIENKATKQMETQILVRKSANGTSKYGLGTGVPVTRWVLSGQGKAPTGYEYSDPPITFHAKDYPEFPSSRGEEESWIYSKIDMCRDAFKGSSELEDSELEQYALKMKDELRIALSKQAQDGGDSMSSFQLSTNSIILDRISTNPNSVTSAIQGTLRMSGLFAKNQDSQGSNRFVSIDDAPDPNKLVNSCKIYTMFPQMPCPMPLPTTSPEELKQEIETRPSRMAENGQDPHKDKYGRMYTHISTSNVSNTIHGIYFTIDATNLLGTDEVPPALDLFGTKKIEREWVSLTDLKVLEEDGKTLGSVDTKSTFITGFIVRQLVKEGVIEM